MFDSGMKGIRFRDWVITYFVELNFVIINYEKALCSLIPKYCHFADEDVATNFHEVINIFEQYIQF